LTDFSHSNSRFSVFAADFTNNKPYTVWVLIVKRRLAQSSSLLLLQEDFSILKNSTRNIFDKKANSEKKTPGTLLFSQINSACGSLVAIFPADNKVERMLMR
jgi:hypothetical protein